MCIKSNRTVFFVVPFILILLVQLLFPVNLFNGQATTVLPNVNGQNQNQKEESKAALSSQTLPSLSAPASVSAVAIGRTAITLNWSASAGAIGYFVKKYNTSTGVFDIVNQTDSFTYADNSCSANTYYRYLVVAYTIYDGVVYFSPNSAEGTATTPQYCYAPANVTAAAASRTSVTVSWSPAAGAEAYFVKRYNPSTGQFDIIAQTAALSITDTNCAANTNYRYHVVAYVILDGQTRFAPISSEATATTPLYCYAPAHVTAAAANPVTVTLSWPAAAGAEAYFVKRYNPSTSQYDIIAQTAALTVTDASRTPGANYQYQIIAYVVIGGQVRFASELQTSITMPLYVYAPSSVTATIKNAYIVKIAWSAAEGAEGYFLKRYNPSTSQFDIINLSQNLCYVDSDRTPGTNYRYHVVAYRVVGGNTVYSPISPEASVTTPSFSGGPANFAAAEVKADSIRLTWSPVAGATGYILLKYNPNTSQFEFYKTVKIPEYTDFNCLPETSYQYSLLAYAIQNYTESGNNQTATTGYSQTVSVTTPFMTSTNNISATAVGRGQIAVAWKEGSNCQGYVVRRATSEGGPFTNLAMVNTLLYTDTTCTAGVTYYYDVQAYRVVNGVYVFAPSLDVASCATSNELASNSSLGYTTDRIVGMDQFGRTFAPSTGKIANRSVGVYYSAGIGQGAPDIHDIYDLSKIMSQPNGFNKAFYQDAPDSPAGQAHYWGEPLMGYYNSMDPYIIRKHMEMLTNAGVDFILLDASNGFTFNECYLSVMQVLNEMQGEGWNTPKVALFCHSLSLEAVRCVYAEIYAKGKYPSTWYQVNGKPMIIAYNNVTDDIAEAVKRGDYSYNPAPLSATILNFFTFMRPQWPDDPYRADSVPWIEWVQYQYNHNGVMNVSVSSHPNIPYSHSLTQGAVNWGRGWSWTTQSNSYANSPQGTYFQNQWNWVLMNAGSVNMVTVTTWNEWVAFKYREPSNEFMFVDLVTMEYSRDIEMMKGGYEDAFYQQMIKNIRAYEGGAPASTNYIAKTIDISAGGSQWDNVNAVFRDIGMQNYGRNYINSAATATYQQDAPRNNIQEVRVTTDATYIYFYIRAENNITAPAGTNWMHILIGTGTPSVKGWNGYNYLVNRFINGTSSSIESLSSNFTGTTVGSATINRSGKVLQVRIPRSAVGLTGSNTFYFKVADDVIGGADIMNYYTTGSCLPMGRLSFQYN